jgi:hypothetical protein
VTTQKTHLRAGFGAKCKMPRGVYRELKLSSEKSEVTCMRCLGIAGIGAKKKEQDVLAKV